MPLTVLDRGQGNVVSGLAALDDTLDATIVFEGNNNRVDLSPGIQMQGARLNLGSSCSLTVGAGCRLAALEMVAVLDSHIEIGRASNFTWHTRLYLHEPSRIIIGSRCLIASETLLMTSDMHSIIDRQSGLRINPAADILIGDDVWLAHSVTLLGGACVGNGSIVGIGSLVTGSLADHTLSAGRPARILRSGVGWDPRLI